MRFEHEGRSLWYGTSDAPAPADTIEAGKEIPVTIGIQPSDASNIVEVRYRVNEEPIKLVSAKFLRNDPARKAQYFQAKLPAFRVGDTVEYAVICRCAGRQVPDPDKAGKMAISFSVVGVKSDTKEKVTVKPPPSIKDGTATAPTGKTSNTILPSGKFPIKDNRIGQPLGKKDVSASKTKDVKPSGITPGTIKTTPHKPTGSAGAPIGTVKKQKLTEAPNPTLRELVSTVRIDKGQEIVSALSKHGIHTLADIRKAGGLSHLKDTAIPADHPSAKILEAHAHLSVLMSDIQTNAKLIEKGYKGIFDIADTPKRTFIYKVMDTLDPGTAGSLYDSNRKKSRYLNNLVMEKKTNKPPLTIRDGTATAPSSETSKAIVYKASNNVPISNVSISDKRKRSWSKFDPCECKDCDAVVSPRAYLADLLAYATKYLEIERPYPNSSPGASPGLFDFVALEDIETIIHQPFVNLPDSCEAVNKKIHQVRICIEVLRRYLGQRPLTNQGKEADLQKAEGMYRWTAYTTVLKKIGTSYDELRAARIEKDEKKVKELAGRLFIEPEHLGTGGLLNDPTLTEEYLESIFGLVDTNRTPGDWFANNLFRNTFNYRNPPNNSEPKLVTWRKACLRKKWKEEDWRPDTGELPIIDPDLIREEYLQKPRNTTDPAYVLWKERWDWINDHKKGSASEKGRLSTLKEIRENAYKLTSDNLASLNAILEAAQVQPPILERLARSQDEGNNITVSLEQLKITKGEFSYLKRMRELVAGGANLLDSEWSDIYSILVQVEKRKKFQEWRQKRRIMKSS